MEALANCSARASDSRISRRLKALPVDALLALILVDGAAESGSVSGKKLAAKQNENWETRSSFGRASGGGKSGVQGGRKWNESRVSRDCENDVKRQPNSSRLRKSAATGRLSSSHVIFAFA